MSGSGESRQRTRFVPLLVFVIIVATMLAQKPVVPGTKLVAPDATMVLPVSTRAAGSPRRATATATSPPSTTPTTVPEDVHLNGSQLHVVQPEELGRIPVLMYHAFTADTTYLDEWTLLPDQFREQLQWLYDHDFSVLSMLDLVNNEIAVPPGKHPVVLTFDDASAGQFRLIEDGKGTLVPDPATAVGVMEAFFAEHPDFGHTAFFAIIPINCFSYPEEVVSCEDRLTWLARHGYEMGNHTWYHQDLSQADDETLKQQVGDAKIWLDQRVPGLANLSNVLVLPYGAFPATDAQYTMLHDGFTWQGQTIRMEAIITVNGGPSPSPSGNRWTRYSINRYSSEPGTFAYWQDQFLRGETTLYTSDGNPDTITVPETLPEDIAGQFDPGIVASQDMQLVTWRPASDPATTPGTAPPASPTLSDAAELWRVRDRSADRASRCHGRLPLAPFVG